MTPMLYVGDLMVGGSCLDRKQALVELGVGIVERDLGPYLRSPNRLLRSVGHRLGLGPLVSAYNAAVLEGAKSLQQPFVLWVDKGSWLWPDTIHQARIAGAVYIVHYTPDPAITFHRSRHFLKSIPLYDAVITTKHYEVHLYKELGARRVIFSHQGYSPQRFAPGSSDEDVAADVVFIGHAEEHYARLLLAIATLPARLRVWGPGWGRMSTKHPSLHRAYSGEGVFGAEYPRILKSAKIGLGLISKLAPDTSTTRTYEIPASGALLLAERTAEHMDLFAEGREAEFFSTTTELRAKVQKLLSDSALRSQIATAGTRRCTEGGYSHAARLKYVMAQLPQDPFGDRGHTG